jgi:hypothetical protein
MQNGIEKLESMTAIIEEMKTPETISRDNEDEANNHCYKHYHDNASITSATATTTQSPTKGILKMI